MSWKVIAIIESRAGDLEVLPEWAVGTTELNAFDDFSRASIVRDSMQQTVDAQRVPRQGQIETPKTPPIKYLLVPVIDQSTIDQLNGKQPPAQQQAPPALTFGGGANHGRPPAH